MQNNNIGRKIASGMVWRLGEKITAQLVSTLVSIILARILMPEDYGAVAFVLVFISIAEVFVTSGISTSLIQKKDVSETEISTVFYCGFLLSIFLYIVIFAFSPLVSRLCGEDIISPVLRVIAIKLPISAINSVQNAIVSSFF